MAPSARPSPPSTGTTRATSGRAAASSRAGSPRRSRRARSWKTSRSERGAATLTTREPRLPFLCPQEIDSLTCKLNCYVLRCRAPERNPDMTVTTLDPKTALVVIDLQKGLAGHPTVHPFEAIVANAAALAAECRSR